MHAFRDPENLGEPDLKIEGFQLWVHGPFADREDDWLRVTAHCGAVGASVWTEGEFFQTGDIERFAGQCAAILRQDSEAATLESREPNLKASLKVAGSRGHLCLRVNMTLDQFTQRHEMDFDIDQSYLPGIIHQCSAIVRKCRVESEDGR